MRSLVQRRAGVGNFSDTYVQIFDAIGNAAQSGESSTGQIASFLINAGIAVQGVQSLLNNVANDAHATPEQVAFAQAEAAWLSNYQTRSSNGAFWLIGGLLVVGLLVATRND